jgi:hypothetical protein
MMDPISSALGAYGRRAGRWTLFLGLAFSLLTLCTGCGEACLYCDGSDDPCSPDPCGGITNAVGETCIAQGADYTCECDPGYTWDSGSNDCTGEAVGTCEDLEQCLMGCSWNDFSCPLACQSQWTGCECEFDFESPPTACGSSCLSQVPNPLSQAYYECLVECFFDTECQ